MNNRSVLTKVIKAFCIIGGILIIYGLSGFYLLPLILKSKIPALIEQTTKRKASIQKLEFDPFLLRLSLQGFSLLEPNGKPFASFDQFYIDLDGFRSIRQSALAIDKVLLTKPMVRIAKLKNGQFNFNDLVNGKDEAKKEDESLFPVIINKIFLSEGTLGWENAYSRKTVNEEIYPINLDVENLSTQTAEQFPLHLSLALKSGGKLDWQGVTGIQQASSSGSLKLENINLEKILELALQDKPQFDIRGSGLLELEYTTAYDDQAFELGITRCQLKLQGFQFSELGQNNLNVKIQETAFALVGKYKFNFADNKWRFTAEKSKLDATKIELPGLNNSKTLIEIPATMLEASYQADNAGKEFNFVLTGDKFDLNNVTLTESGQHEPLVKIPSLNLRGIGFNLANREISTETIKSGNAEFKAWLKPDGKINYLDLLPVAQGGDQSPETAAEPAPQGKSDWNISVQSLALDNFGLSFEDRSLKKPVLFNVKPFNIKLDNFTNKTGASLPVQFDAVINKTGSIKLAGDAIVSPFSSRLKVNVNDIDLEKFQPYLESYARLDIIDGQLNVDGEFAIALPADDKPDMKFKGNTHIAGLLTRDQILNKDFVKWKKLTLNDIDADVKANRYTAKQLLIEKPYARVIIAKDKTINVNDVLITAKTHPAASTKTEKKRQTSEDKTYFKLDKVKVIDGSSDFADLSLILPFAAQIKSLDGGASGVSSEKDSTMKVSLKGNAYDLAPVEINGEISPYLGDYNIQMKFQGMPMPLVSPYMVQFAGYKVEKGKLTLELKYQVVNRQLTASNSIFIDQFELGEKVENPEAVSVPLELAVALLKDSDGKIKLDVPITGSLEDPKFSLGKIIVQALLNAISKVVTSPFNAIASMIGSEQNLSVINFAPGQAELDIQQKTKLDSIALALKDRPVLNIEIKGAVFQEQDWPAMRKAALYDQVKELKAAEENKNGGKKVLSEYIELTDKDYKRLLAQMFIEKFPLMAEKSLLGTPRLVQPEAGDFYVVAEQKLSEIIKPEPERMKALAADRAQVIAKYIVQHGGINNDRVFILDTVIDPQRDNTDVVSFLSLKAN